MDWVEFFEKTRQAAGVESFAKLAPKLGISDGAISHYRTGKRVPQVWVVAECLNIQGHPQPEKAAIQIMKSEAQTSPERHFWKRLAATAMALCLAVGFALPHKAEAAVPSLDKAHVVYIMRNIVSPDLGLSLLCVAMAGPLVRLLPSSPVPSPRARMRLGHVGEKPPALRPTAMRKRAQSTAIARLLPDRRGIDQVEMAPNKLLPSTATTNGSSCSPRALSAIITTPQ